MTTTGIGTKPADSLMRLEAERSVPEKDAYQAAWMRARYAWAARHAAGRDVFDAGCGEGYGSAFLAGIAESVTAVDYSPAAIEHASTKYRRPNLRYAQADIGALSDFDGPFDLITCFEVIEHIEDHRAVFTAFAARLRSGGKLVLSTPNALYHGPAAIDRNPYHVSEVSHTTLAREARQHFARVRLFGQLNRAELQRSLAKLVVDPFYLRRRLSRTPTIGNATSHDGANGQTTAPAAPRDFVFSRAVARVAPVAVIVATA